LRPEATTSRRPLPSQDDSPRQLNVRVSAALDQLGVPAEESWATLRQAEAATGVAGSTIRNWARKGKVASRLDQRVDGPRRMVKLEDVVARSSQLRTPPPVPRTGNVRSEGPPEGQMLIPLDAWERMLIQLGNLHEAGQQLADARERAAKAETEAGFLRERLAEFRAERDQLRERVDEIRSQPEPLPRQGAAEKRVAPLWRRLLSELRSRPKW
jgi:hypothetical protein